MNVIATTYLSTLKIEKLSNFIVLEKKYYGILLVNNIHFDITSDEGFSNNILFFFQNYTTAIRIFANNLDPHQTPSKLLSDQDPNCLTFRHSVLKDLKQLNFQHLHPKIVKEKTKFITNIYEKKKPNTQIEG